MRQACVRCGKPSSKPVCPECREKSYPNERPYDEAAWRLRSAAFLRRFGKCALCGEVAKVADHWPHTRRELLARGEADPDREEFLRPLCLSCHARHGRRSSMRFNNDPA